MPDLVTKETICRQLDDLIELVEASIPASPSSVENEKLANSTAKLMADYFTGLEQAFPYHQLEAIYNKYVKVTEVGIMDNANDIMDPILRVLRAKLLTDLIGQHVRAYLAASAEMITWGTTKGGRPITFEGPPIKQAISYAREHCAQLVTKMDEESKRLIAQTIANGIENKRGIDGLARDIRAQFEDMSKARSQIIARTETCDALEQAFIDRAEDMGINGKEWIVTDPCDICAANGDEGAVPLDHVFSGGVDRPPQHPNCRCALAPVMLKE